MLPEILLWLIDGSAEVANALSLSSTPSMCWVAVRRPTHNFIPAVLAVPEILHRKQQKLLIMSHELA